MTYFLEKHYWVDYDGKLKPSTYGHCLVRPCQLSYDDLLEVFKHRSKRAEVRLEGMVAYYGEASSNASVEEWLINLSLDKGISPDFEYIVISSIDSYDEYVAKTTDLHTKEVLYDNVEEITKKLQPIN